MTPADQLARIEQDATALRAALARIKESPALCSQFLAACATLRGLEKEVRAAALAFLEAREPVPEVELNEGRLSSVVTSETILELVRDPDPKRQIVKLTAFAQAACPVRESVYFAFCRMLGIKPSGAHVQRSRGQPFVIFKGAVGAPWRSGRQP
jgi:predicted small secreted protein